MLGGIDITEQARAHAREMLASATRSAPAEPMKPESMKKKRAPAARR
jgi:hypothetical protein